MQKALFPQKGKGRDKLLTFGVFPSQQSNKSLGHGLSDKFSMRWPDPMQINESVPREAIIKHSQPVEAVSIRFSLQWFIVAVCSEDETTHNKLSSFLRIRVLGPPLSSEFGTYRTVRTRIERIRHL
jgi:hypothetical protein